MQQTFDVSDSKWANPISGCWLVHVVWLGGYISNVISQSSSCRLERASKKIGIRSNSWRFFSLGFLVFKSFFSKGGLGDAKLNPLIWSINNHCLYCATKKLYHLLLCWLHYNSPFSKCPATVTSVDKHLDVNHTGKTQGPRGKRGLPSHFIWPTRVSEVRDCLNPIPPIHKGRVCIAFATWKPQHTL